MKKSVFLFATAVILLGMNSCKKCAECHYDKDGKEYELSEVCGKDKIKDMEANGHTIDGVKYDVHCSDH
jgi:hypothetical protein